jgi:acetylornithine aminotransferase
LAAIDVIVKEKLDKKAEKTGKYLMEKIREEGCTVRGKGLMIGVDAKGRETVLELIKRKILTINSKDTVRMLPPLTIGKEHCDTFISALKKVI